MKKIIATGKSEHMPKGTEYLESDDMADLLVSMGAAVYEGTGIKEQEPNKKTGPEIKVSEKPKKKK
jgi:hypothetical protein